jgi:anti-sigma regulatory factor (Ser/Thr protein kinase)
LKTEDLSFELAGGSYAVTAARLALADIDSRLDPSTAFDVRLLVSELVTNSVQHADIGPEDSIAMRVLIRTRGVRIEIGDGGSGFQPPAEPPDPSSDTGWGLFIVEQLADAWGVERDYVWFELRHSSDRGDGEPERSDVAA